MSDTQANAQPTSLSEVYASASAAQTPTAPPALNAAIMQAAAQVASTRSAAASAEVAAPVSTTSIQFAVPESAPAKPSLPSGERWREGFALLQQLIQAAATRLQNIFAIPTLRYGLPAMMVAAVGFKIALPEAPTMRDSAPPAAVSAPAAASEPVAAGADIASVLPAKPASAPASSVAKTVLNKTDNSETKAAQLGPAAGDERATKNGTVMADSGNKEAWSETKGKDNAQTAGTAAMGFPIELPRQPQVFPAERGNSPSEGGLVKSDAVLSQAKPAPLKQMLAEPAPIAAAPAMPAPMAMPAATPTAPVVSGMTRGVAASSAYATTAAPEPAMKMQARAALESPSPPPSAVTKELRLRWLIATNREVDGRVQESCNTSAPKLEQVQSWLSSGANPNYVLNGVSTLALAQHCGFTEAAQAMK